MNKNAQILPETMFFFIALNDSCHKYADRHTKVTPFVCYLFTV